MITTNKDNTNLGIQFDLEEKAGEVVAKGIFRIKESEDYALEEHLYGAIVLAITTPTAFLTVNPFQDVVAFEDDIGRTNGKIVGEFNISISRAIKNFADDKYFVMLSLGAYLSPIKCYERK